MIVGIKKIGQEMDFLKLVNPTADDYKKLIGAEILASIEITDTISCYYDAVVDMNAPVNFVLLEEEFGDMEFKGFVRSNVVFVNTEETDGLSEEDVMYLFRNYMKTTVKDELNKTYYDSLEIFADIEDSIF